MQAIRPGLPATLQACLDDPTRPPPRVLLERLLQRPGGTAAPAEWALTVLAAYTSCCGLAASETESNAAQAGMTASLVSVQALTASLACLSAESAMVAREQGATEGGSAAGPSSAAAADRLAYFSSKRALEEAGVALLMRQRMEGNPSVSALEALGVAGGSGGGGTTVPAAATEVLLMALCLPSLLEAQRSQSNRRRPADSSTPQKAGRPVPEGELPQDWTRRVGAAAAELLLARPQTILECAPALVGQACRASFKFSSAFVAAVAALRAAGTPKAAFASVLAQACLLDGHTAAFIKDNTLPPRL